MIASPLFGNSLSEMWEHSERCGTTVKVHGTRGYFKKNYRWIPKRE